MEGKDLKSNYKFILLFKLFPSLSFFPKPQFITHISAAEGEVHPNTWPHRQLTYVRTYKYKRENLDIKFKSAQTINRKSQPNEISQHLFTTVYSMFTLINIMENPKKRRKNRVTQAKKIKHTSRVATWQFFDSIPSHDSH